MEQSIASRPAVKAGDLEIRPSSAPAGAEIFGADIAAGLAPDALQRVRDALHKYKAVVLRDQVITPEQQIAFSGMFGTLEPHVLPQFLVPGYKELVRVSNVMDDQGKPIGLVDAGRIWHTDGHFLEKPNMYSMLYALEIPHAPDGRPLGATKFVSTAYAYSTLPEQMRARIQGLRGVNSLASVYKLMHGLNATKNRPPLTEEQKREVVHPIVRTHPATGEKCIYVSRAATSHIEGLSQEESDEVIGYLADHCVREEAVYAHQWKEGDLLMWDNCGAQHLAIGDYALPQRRVLHRTTVSGQATF